MEMESSPARRRWVPRGHPHPGEAARISHAPGMQSLRQPFPPKANSLLLILASARPLASPPDSKLGTCRIRTWVKDYHPPSPPHHHPPAGVDLQAVGTELLQMVSPRKQDINFHELGPSQ
jgi:hypothetical protein